jgi:geranylgeranyl diphosphate synthase type 3
VNHQYDKALLEPYVHIEQTQGKGMREKLIDAFNQWLKVDEDKLEVIKQIITKLHTASLLIDDIEDNSKLRRGVPVAHHIFGVASTINCANYVYFESLDMLYKLHNPTAIGVFVEELVNLHRGQGYDILWRDTSTCPTEAEYTQMVLDKTGGLLRLGARLMQSFSACSADLIPLVNTFSLYYQIRDDYINLQSNAYMQNKSFCEDLTEGKFSYPIIHSIRATPHDHRLLNILKRKTDDEDTKRYAVQVMTSTQSFQYTLDKLQVLAQQLRGQIAALGGNVHIDRIIDYLTNNLI